MEMNFFLHALNTYKLLGKQGGGGPLKVESTSLTPAKFQLQSVEDGEPRRDEPTSTTQAENSGSSSPAKPATPNNLDEVQVRMSSRLSFIHFLVKIMNSRWLVNPTVSIILKRSLSRSPSSSELEA